MGGSGMHNGDIWIGSLVVFVCFECVSLFSDSARVSVSESVNDLVRVAKYDDEHDG